MKAKQLLIDFFLLFSNTSNPSYAEKRVFYDNSAKSLAYYNEVNGITVNLGQESLIRVFNNTGATILNGKAVYINGSDATSGLATVALAKSDADATAETIGICTNDIATGTIGYITTIGVVHDIDTSAFVAGSPLYISPSTAGALTTAAPTAPNIKVRVGYVAKSNATTGSIMVLVGAAANRKFEVYVDDVLQTAQTERRWYNLTTAGGNGEASKFLTSDGLTKSGGNTFLFTTVIGAGGNSKTIASDTECDSFAAFQYDAATGNARWRFAESNTSSIGALGGTAEGTEDTENGTAVAVWVEGVK